MTMEIIHKSQTPAMFDQIAVRYDLFNILLSFGQHKKWRREVVKRLPDSENLHVLDLATGTGDQIIALLGSSKVKSVIGLDPSVEMLTIGERKIAKRFPKADVTLVEADAAEIPFNDNEFDIVTMAFGIRNIPDEKKVIREMMRVLKPEGRILILESSVPKNSFYRCLHHMYLVIFVRGLAGFLSGHPGAYKYFNLSVEAFYMDKKFSDELEGAGFKNVKVTKMMLQGVSIYDAQKL